MNLKCTQITKTTIGGNLTPREIVCMLNSGYRIDGNPFMEQRIRAEDDEGITESRWIYLIEPRS